MQFFLFLIQKSYISRVLKHCSPCLLLTPSKVLFRQLCKSSCLSLTLKCEAGVWGQNDTIGENVIIRSFQEITSSSLSFVVVCAVAFRELEKNPFAVKVYVNSRSCDRVWHPLCSSSLKGVPISSVWLQLLYHPVPTFSETTQVRLSRGEWMAALQVLGSGSFLSFRNCWEDCLQCTASIQLHELFSWGVRGH